MLPSASTMAPAPSVNPVEPWNVSERAASVSGRSLGSPAFSSLVRRSAGVANVMKRGTVVLEPGR